MNKNNNKKSIKNDNSFDYELENSNSQIPIKEYITYPEESVLLDFNLSLSHWELSIEALKKVIEDRDINKEIKIKKQNKYKKSLTINDLNIQIALCGLGAEEVTIPLDIWESAHTAPQIILVAQVDDENNIIFSSSSEDISNLSAGTYTLIVTDVENPDCFDTIETILIEPTDEVTINQFSIDNIAT